VFADTAQSGNILNRLFLRGLRLAHYSQREKTPEMMVLKVGSLDAPGIAQGLSWNIWTRLHDRRDAIERAGP